MHSALCTAQTCRTHPGCLVSAAIRPQSAPALALERAWLHYEVCASQETFTELQDLLSRSKFDRYASPEIRQAFVDGLLRHLRMVEVTQLVRECSDPKDDKFLALALAVNAEMIVASAPPFDANAPLASHPYPATGCLSGRRALSV